MKTSFKQYIQEALLLLAKSEEDLLASIKNGKFTLDGNKLEIASNFSCNNNELTSLEGVPVKVEGDFFCDINNLTSLEGAPSIVGGSFYCDRNLLTSLEGIHKYITLIGESAIFLNNPIKSHVLGLLKIKYLKKVYLDNRDVQIIINQYLPEGDIFACQQELIDAGFDEYAQL